MTISLLIFLAVLGVFGVYLVPKIDAWIEKESALSKVVVGAAIFLGIPVGLYAIAKIIGSIFEG